MRTIRPDDGSSIRTSKIYLRNHQAFQAFRFMSDGEDTVVELLLLPSTTSEALGGDAVDLSQITRTTIEWL